MCLDIVNNSVIVPLKEGIRAAGMAAVGQKVITQLYGPAKGYPAIPSNVGKLLVCRMRCAAKEAHPYCWRPKRPNQEIWR
jgi:hypothetical protein